VVSRAGWPDSLASQHPLQALAQAALLHAGRPTVVTVGAGALPCGVAAKLQTKAMATSCESPVAEMGLTTA